MICVTTCCVLLVIAYGCATAGVYAKIVLTISRDFLQIVRMFCHDLTDMSCSRLTLLLIFTGFCCCCLLFVVVVCFVLVCFVSC